MERQKNIGLILLMLFGASTSIFASSYQKRIYNAYISNNMNSWKAVIDEMEDTKKVDLEFLTELVNYQYGYIGYCLGKENTDEAKKYLALAQNNLKKLEKAGAEESVINAYKSAFYGYSIGLNKMKAPFLGPKSIKHSRLAIEQNPNNPMGYIQYGNSQFYMPPVFGGSKQEAIEYFKKAEQLIEKGNYTNDCNYLSLMALIGQSYAITEEYKNAKAYYNKALQVEPEFLWVKQELMPQLLEKTK
jgi:tetratricopeptide (TPR) repeat protein